MDAAAVDPQLFRDTMSRWASGVTVVTSRDENGPIAMTVSSFASLSLEPPLVMVCVGQHALSHDGLVAAEGFVVNVLAEDQAELSDRFARRGAEKWDGITLDEGPFRAPLLPLGTARLACARHATLEGGDHTILIGRVLSSEITENAPLVFWNRGYRSIAR